MKLACVAQHRIDIAEAVKCLTRHMKGPRSGHMVELKRLGRPILDEEQEMRADVSTSLQMHVDADWAGDLLEGKSTTGVIVRRSKLAETHVLLNSFTLPRLDD